MKSLSLRLALAVFACSCSAGFAQDYVWWEGEKPAETNFPASSPFVATNYPKTRAALSEGDWLTSGGKRGDDELFARYDVTVPKAGKYQFWARKFWKHGPFRWRFSQGQWQTCGKDVGLADEETLAQFICVNWVFLGEVTLPAGKQSFELRLLAQNGEEATACFDCFLLSPAVFVPNGRFKPGHRSGQADEGFFAWEPATDEFKSDALLNLRSLNESQAGERGYVRAQGGQLVLGDGTPARFWAVNVGPGCIEQSHASMDYLAAALAKRGVNMVRCHSAVFDESAADPATINKSRLDGLQYFVTALKKQGIYTEISFYFPLWLTPKPASGLEGYSGDAKPFAMLFYQPRMQEIHRAWAKAIMTTPNPYADQKTPLAKDPAVAIVEILNEDSFFFWTFSKANIPAVHWKRLEGLYADWLAKRYGSLDKALAAWGGRRNEDSPDKVALFEAWTMTTDGVAKSGVPVKRISDQVRFLTELQRGFYADFTSYLKKNLGYGGLVACSNWTVTDADMLDGLERYTYTVGDVIDRHGYFSGKHEGDSASWSVRAGHTFSSKSALTAPNETPVSCIQVEEQPNIITEIGWPNPNRYRADATLLAASYGCLQGQDAFFWFAVGSNYLNDTSMSKFPVSTPVMAGSFPATALMFRRGYVKTGEPVFREKLSVEALYEMKGSAGQAAALDELRKADIPGGVKVAAARLDPLAGYVGPVLRTFDPKARPVLADVSSFIDRSGKVVRSNTGELALDIGRGLLTVNSPFCRAAAGFLAKAGPTKLGDVTIRCGNEYASVIVASLDGKPLAEAVSLLVQATTDDQPFGFRESRGRISAMGGPPMNVRKVDATVTLPQQTGKPWKVVALDENGYATDKKVSVTADAGEAAIQLLPDSLYYVVTR